ncbi:MAG: hypothetical protein HC825_05755 [Oscillatoriales cyanobacterium RM1_1_9]|nr:hypothetical protein [Oscillatoriales cyanobacterium RM2_1_1]NJO71324.1 hypothetical protein [Oscillatoriales cyanobacterium RM1_1_9]
MFQVLGVMVLLPILLTALLTLPQAVLADELPTVATVQKLVMGDRACYVDLTDTNGQTSTQYAAFEICQQDLVGKQVQLTYKPGRITAASCQGNPECGETEEVMLITEAKVLSSPSTTDSSKVQGLANGNYRYWNGSSGQTIVTDQELLKQGGVLFRFRKTASNIIGVFAYVDGEAICVSGQINGDTVTGIAVQNLAPPVVLSNDDTFVNFGPSGLLKVRRGRQISPQKVRYDSALLDLKGLNRINAGAVAPPDAC